MFLLQAEDDPIDTVKNSLVYYYALKKARVSVEMHLYAQGGHGFGIRRTKMPITGWPPLVEKWLEYRDNVEIVGPQTQLLKHRYITG
jgi:acetyl esterase/lipase